MPTRLDVGDQLGNMRVEAMQVQAESVDSTSWTGSVDFSGTVTLTGRFRPHPAFESPGPLCFYPDSTSAAQLPRFLNDERISWFCFSNTGDSEAALGGPAAEGEATIVINEFNYLYEPSDTHNRARLQQVLQRR